MKCRSSPEAALESHSSSHRKILLEKKMENSPAKGKFSDQLHSIITFNKRISQMILIEYRVRIQFSIDPLGDGSMITLSTEIQNLVSTTLSRKFSQKKTSNSGS